MPPTLKLALTLNQPPTPTGAQFSSGGNSLSQTLTLTGSNFPRGQLSGYRFHILNCCKIDLTSNLKGRQTLGRYLKVRSNLPEKQWSHFLSRLDRYLLNFKPYLLLLLIHLSLLLLNYSELNFILSSFSLKEGQVTFPLS